MFSDTFNYVDYENQSHFSTDPGYQCFQEASKIRNFRKIFFKYILLIPNFGHDPSI